MILYVLIGIAVIVFLVWWHRAHERYMRETLEDMKKRPPRPDVPYEPKRRFNP